MDLLTPWNIIWQTERVTYTISKAQYSKTKGDWWTYFEILVSSYVYVDVSVQDPCIPHVQEHDVSPFLILKCVKDVSSVFIVNVGDQFQQVY